MKVLIGTPIHESKDYSMKRWLENVAKLQQQTPADLLLVDNSPGFDYAEIVRGCCIASGVKNFKIEHFETQSNGADNSGSRRIEIAQEMIRRKALQGEYDAWFSWECDQIMPNDALKRLIGLMESENYMMVFHNSWARTDPAGLNANMGCALIGKEALQKGWFLDEKDGEIDFVLSDKHRVDETAFRRRVIENDGNYVEVFGVITPIYHLNKQI